MDDVPENPDDEKVDWRVRGHLFKYTEFTFDEFDKHLKKIEDLLNNEFEEPGYVICDIFAEENQFVVIGCKPKEKDTSKPNRILKLFKGKNEN